MIKQTKIGEAQILQKPSKLVQKTVLQKNWKKKTFSKNVQLTSDSFPSSFLKSTQTQHFPRSIYKRKIIWIKNIQPYLYIFRKHKKKHTKRFISQTNQLKFLKNLKKNKKIISIKQRIYISKKNTSLKLIKFSHKKQNFLQILNHLKTLKKFRLLKVFKKVKKITKIYSISTKQLWKANQKTTNLLTLKYKRFCKKKKPITWLALPKVLTPIYQVELQEINLQSKKLLLTQMSFLNNLQYYRKRLYTILQLFRAKKKFKFFFKILQLQTQQKLTKQLIKIRKRERFYWAFNKKIGPQKINNTNYIRHTKLTIKTYNLFRQVYQRIIHYYRFPKERMRRKFWWKFSSQFVSHYQLRKHEIEKHGNFFKTSFGQSVFYSIKDDCYWHRAINLHPLKFSQIIFPEGEIPFYMYYKNFLWEKKLGWYFTTIYRSQFARQMSYKFGRKNLAKQFSLRQIKQTHTKYWLEPLVFRRKLYRLYTHKKKVWTDKPWLKPYFRLKLPWKEKRNRLYVRYITRYFAFKRTPTEIRAKQHAYVKKNMRKIILAFYGNLRVKQMLKIKHRVQHKKSFYVDKPNIFLGKFERRLDVIVYRLKWAPTILWARRLIKDGLIFVSNTQEWNWVKQYNSIKKYAYPIHIRDPKCLYEQQCFWPQKNFEEEPWSIQNKYTKHRFLTEPIKQIDYLVNRYEIIQCAPSIYLANFKYNARLDKRKIPAYLLTFPKFQPSSWKGKTLSLPLRTKALAREVLPTAMLWEYPTFADFEQSDRITTSFMDWISL